MNKRIRRSDVPPWEQPAPQPVEPELPPDSEAIDNPLDFMEGEIFADQAKDPKHDPHRNPPDAGEVPSEQFMPRPLYAWGILGATVGSLRDSFAKGKNRLGLSSMAINIIDPADLVSYPGIVVTLNHLEVKSSGFHPVWVRQDRGQYPNPRLYPNDAIIDENQWYYPPYPDGETSDSREFVDISTGEIGITLVSQNTGEIIKLQDYMTQLYQMSYLYPDTFYLDAQNRKYVAIGYQPGVLTWGEFTRTQDEQMQGRAARVLYKVSTSFKFWAEHTFPFELDRIESVDVEAVPLSALI